MGNDKPQFERPQVQRTQVIAKDMITGKSKTKTVYGATPETVIEVLEKAISGRKQPAASAA